MKYVDFHNGIMSIRWLKSGHTMKYGYCPRDCPRAPPSGNPSGENHISWYVPPLANVLLQYETQQTAAFTIMQGLPSPRGPGCTKPICILNIISHLVKIFFKHNYYIQWCVFTCYIFAVGSQVKIASLYVLYKVKCFLYMNLQDKSAC